ncbi:MAG: isochorismate synthase [Myxococcota bacterium]
MTAASLLAGPLRAALAARAREAVERGGIAVARVEVAARDGAGLALFAAVACDAVACDAGARDAGATSRDEAGGSRAVRAAVDRARAADLAVGSGERFYWDQPSERRALAALGAVASVEASGAERLDVAAARARALFARIALAADGAPTELAPALVGGFAFEPEDGARGDWAGFAPLSFALPALGWARDGNRAHAFAAAAPGPGESPASLAARIEAALAPLAAALGDARVDDALRRPPATASAYTARPDRPHADYLAAVDAARDAIGVGALEKVVVARSLAVETDVPYDAVALLASLRRVHATSTVFAVARGDGVFAGATPERLLRIDGDRLATAALAGTAPRGRSPDEDDRLARALRESEKDQEEHAFVARDIEAVIAPFVERVERDEAPDLLALDGIQHLHTPIGGRLVARADGGRPHLFEIAARLHPTPAVGGAPRAAARAWIRAHERLARGWYAGGVGFATATGGGELRVALRSGLVRGAHARLFAGAGIVAGSVPENELAETRLKLRAMLSQLTEI